MKILQAGALKLSLSPQLVAVSNDDITKLSKQFEKTISDPSVGFFNLPLQTKQDLKPIQQACQQFAHKKIFVHVGIGGSSLGPEMLIKALAYNSKKQFIFLNNVDADLTAMELGRINHQDALFYFVSKSGTTAETMATMAVVINWLKEKGVTSKNWKDYFVFSTDPEMGDLKALSKEFGITALPIPNNVGGRYSILSSVGLFPAAFANIDIEALIQGSNELRTALLKKESASILYTMALQLFQLYQKQVNQTVIMPYSSLLKDFAGWFTQLWAESLGKKHDIQGQKKHKGLTPISAYGTTDQHSQMQLFMEGPFDKAIILIQIEKSSYNFSLDCGLNHYDSLKRIAQTGLSELCKAELLGTIKALEENERPYFLLTIPELSAKSIGQLILFFESLTVTLGHLLEVNPFDQPGVELGKKYCFELLNTPSTSR